MRITLDYMCCVDLEEDRQPHASDLRELGDLCKSKGITLATYGFGFLENPKPDGTRREPWEFKAWLNSLGVGQIELLGPGTLWVEIGGYLSAECHNVLMQKVHEILFPRIDFDYEAYVGRRCEQEGLDRNSLDPETVRKISSKWNNAKCDALGLCAHLAEGVGIFVTRDDNFRKNVDRLRELAPDLKILPPQEALASLRG